LVEQRIENPRVGSSILPQATNLKAQLFAAGLFLCRVAQQNQKMNALVLTQ
jgi:hypothetical protein